MFTEREKRALKLWGVFRDSIDYPTVYVNNEIMNINAFKGIYAFTKITEVSETIEKIYAPLSGNKIHILGESPFTIMLELLKDIIVRFKHESRKGCDEFLKNSGLSAVKGMGEFLDLVETNNYIYVKLLGSGNTHYADDSIYDAIVDYSVFVLLKKDVDTDDLLYLSDDEGDYFIKLKVHWGGNAAHYSYDIILQLDSDIASFLSSMHSFDMECDNEHVFYSDDGFNLYPEVDVGCKHGLISRYQIINFERLFRNPNDFFNAPIEKVFDEVDSIDPSRFLVDLSEVKRIAVRIREWNKDNENEILKKYPMKSMLIPYIKSENKLFCPICGSELHVSSIIDSYLDGEDYKVFKWLDSLSDEQKLKYIGENDLW